MQTQPEKFPPQRRDDPMRLAEARVFDELRNNPLPGFACYEWQRDHNSPQIDFAIWLSGVGRFGLEVKGGRYSLEKGKWRLETGRGPQKKACPVRKTRTAIMSLHDEIVKALEREAPFIAVLVFPDMEPDQAIMANARRSNVHVIWGVDGLVDKLQDIAAETEVYNPPDEGDIAREVAAVTNGQVLYAPPADRLPPRDGAPLPPGNGPGLPMEVPAGNIIIQHADTLNVHTVPGWTPQAGKARAIDMPADEANPIAG